MNIKVSENQYAEAVINYRQHLYTALAEVEDALSARVKLGAEAEKLGQSLEQAKRAEVMTQVRYRAGATNVQLWLDAQQRVRSAENALSLNRSNQLSNHIKLHKALGDDVSHTCAVGIASSR
jgi:outer membrane protein TolC